MVDTYLRQSPLAALHLLGRSREDNSNAGVLMGERDFRCQWVLRANGTDTAVIAAVKDITGCDLPLDPNTTKSAGDIDILWLGPDEWLVTAPDGASVGDDLATALSDVHCAVTDVSESRTIIVLSGKHARDVLAKGCALDFHPRSFVVGQCAQSMLAHNHVILHQRSIAPAYDVYVHRSFAESLWQWLEDAAAEYDFGISNPA